MKKPPTNQAIPHVDAHSSTVQSRAAPLDLSVIIPAYNEETRLGKSLHSVRNYLEERGLSFEVLVVDDGSTDRTSEIVRAFARHFSFRNGKLILLRYENNRGKGYAVRHGIKQARGKLLLLYDSDGATPIHEFERLEPAIQGGADVVIGSRAMSSKNTAVHSVWYRKWMGRLFNGLVNFLILPGIADTQCGFKLFTKQAATQIFSLQTAERFSFDVEILFIARKLGFEISEVPVNWTNIPGSKVNLIGDSISMFRDILKFRYFSLINRYRVSRQSKIDWGNRIPSPKQSLKLPHSIEG